MSEVPLYVNHLLGDRPGLLRHLVFFSQSLKTLAVISSHRVSKAVKARFLAMSGPFSVRKCFNPCKFFVARSAVVGVTLMPDLPPHPAQIQNTSVFEIT